MTAFASVVFLLGFFLHLPVPCVLLGILIELCRREVTGFPSFTALCQAVKKLQLHMLTLSLYHLDHQRHWLVRLGRPPKGPEEPSLAVLIHGGPHSCASCMYNRDVLFLTTLGFDVLVVNYRGSAGFGQDELVSLHGQFGGLSWLKSLFSNALAVLR